MLAGSKATAAVRAQQPVAPAFQHVSSCISTGGARAPQQVNVGAVASSSSNGTAAATHQQQRTDSDMATSSGQHSRRSLLLLTAVAPVLSQAVAAPPARAAAGEVFLDIKIADEPAGTIIIELFQDVKTGAERFRDLAQGKQGVGYRLSKFNGIFDTYIRNDGVNRLSYSATEESPITGGDTLEGLERELEAQTRTHDTPGLVSLIVKESKERPVTEKLVAMNGKLVTIRSQAGEAPNGTQFTILLAPTPELDATNLVLGRVVQGMDLVRAIAALPINKPRDDNPYFLAGKAIGDKRATVAEKGFNRPFKKVVVTKAGVLA